MNDDRPIVCVDLNGVLDAYTGWKHEEHWRPRLRRRPRRVLPGDFSETLEQVQRFSAHWE